MESLDFGLASLPWAVPLPCPCSERWERRLSVPLSLLSPRGGRGCPVVSGETHGLVLRPGAVQVPAASSLGWCRRRPGRDSGLPRPPVVTGCPPHSDSRGSAGTSEGPRPHPTQGGVSRGHGPPALLLPAQRSHLAPMSPLPGSCP